MGLLTKLLSSGNYGTYNRFVAKEIGLECAILLGVMFDLADGYGNSFFYQQDRLVEKTCLTEYALNAATKKLVERGFLTTTRKGIPAQLYYTLNESSVFQYLEDAEQVPRNQGTGSSKSRNITISKEPISNTRMIVPSDDPILSLGNGKESNVITVSVPDQRFTEFWTFYPKKIGKGAAENVYRKLKPDEALHKTILAAIVKAKKSAQWTRDGGQYIPNPATWLNQKRWEDELDSGQQPQRDPRLDFFLGGDDDNPE